MNFINNITAIFLLSLVFALAAYADDERTGGMTEEEFLAKVAEIERALKIYEQILNNLETVIEELEKGSDEINKTLLSEDV